MRPHYATVDARCCSIGVEVELFKRIKQKHREDVHLCSHFTAKQNAPSSVRSPLCSASSVGNDIDMLFFLFQHFICGILVICLAKPQDVEGAPGCPLAVVGGLAGSAGKLVKHN